MRPHLVYSQMRRHQLQMLPVLHLPRGRELIERKVMKMEVYFLQVR